jgi:hypothetical protein
MKEEVENAAAKLALRLLRMDLMILWALALIGVFGIKDIINTTKTTKALSEVAQKVGVDFPTKTNNVFGVWQVVKPL